MKRLIIALILVALFVFVDPGLARVIDPQDEITGKQLIEGGAPWLADNQKMYFGDDKDGYIDWKTATGELELYGVALDYTGGLTIGSGNDLQFAGGDSLVDFHLGSGIFKTTTGAVTIGPGLAGIAGAKFNGNVMIGSSGTNTLTVSGAVLEQSLAVNGTTALTGLAALNGAKFNGNVLIGSAGTDALTVSGATTTQTLVANGTSVLTGLTTANGAKFNGNVLVGSTGTVTLIVSGATTLQSLAVNGTSALTGLSTLNGAKFNGNVLIGSTGTATLAVSGSTTTQTLVVNGTSLHTGIATFTATPVFNGGATIATAQTLAVTTADKLTVGGIIVPQEMPLTVDYVAATADHAFFIADQAYKVTAIREVHSTVGGSGAVMNIEKLTSTTAPGSGTNCQSTTTDLTTTINAVQTISLSALASDYTLAAGDRLGINVGGTPGSQAGTVTVYIQRIANP